MNAHIEAEHNTEKSFVCPTCNLALSSKRGLKVHIETVHEGRVRVRNYQKLGDLGEKNICWFKCFNINF